jgi:hypothetical protein
MLLPMQSGTLTASSMVMAEASSNLEQNVFRMMGIVAGHCRLPPWVASHN